MDTLNTEALEGLASLLASLLPPAPDPALRPLLTVVPLRIVPTGLGSFVSLHDTPVGQVQGRRLQARALVTVRAAALEALDDAVTLVTRALLAGDAAALRGQGLLNVVLDEIGPRSTAAGGAGAPAQRDLSLLVLYEYLKIPTEAEGTIQEVPLNVTIG